MDRALEERLTAMHAKIEQSRALRAEVYAEIRDIFPETRGQAPIRGLLNRVSIAVGMSREYVARIRDGKVQP